MAVSLAPALSLSLSLSDFSRFALKVRVFEHPQPSGEDVVNGSYAVGRALDVREPADQGTELRRLPHFPNLSPELSRAPAQRA